MADAQVTPPMLAAGRTAAPGLDDPTLVAVYRAMVKHDLRADLPRWIPIYTALFAAVVLGFFYWFDTLRCR